MIARQINIFDKLLDFFDDFSFLQLKFSKVSKDDMKMHSEETRSLVVVVLITIQRGRSGDGAVVANSLTQEAKSINDTGILRLLHASQLQSQVGIKNFT